MTGILGDLYIWGKWYFVSFMTYGMLFWTSQLSDSLSVKKKKNLKSSSYIDFPNNNIVYKGISVINPLTLFKLSFKLKLEIWLLPSLVFQKLWILYLLHTLNFSCSILNKHCIQDVFLICSLKAWGNLSYMARLPQVMGRHSVIQVLQV